jgi:hypothetical protein
MKKEEENDETCLLDFGHKFALLGVHETRSFYQRLTLLLLFPDTFLRFHEALLKGHLLHFDLVLVETVGHFLQVEICLSGCDVLQTL